MQRAQCTPLSAPIVGRSGLGQRQIRIQKHPGANRGIGLFNPQKARLQQLYGGKTSLAYTTRRFRGGQGVQIHQAILNQMDKGKLEIARHALLLASEKEGASSGSAAMMKKGAG
jgi:hypothetical protein